LNESEDEEWLQIAPLLDMAIARLDEKDRHAIVLRFFQNKSLSEIGSALGASEDGARMRVNRALEKLRRFFGKRGIASTTAIIAGAISPIPFRPRRRRWQNRWLPWRCQRRDGQQFNRNPHQRSIEIVAWTKQKRRWPLEWRLF